MVSSNHSVTKVNNVILVSPMFGKIQGEELLFAFTGNVILSVSQAQVNFMTEAPLLTKKNR